MKIPQFADSKCFTDIYLSNCPEEEQNTLSNMVHSNSFSSEMLPTKQPYIIFYLRLNNKKLKRDFFTPHIFQLKSLGKTQVMKKNYYAITITGHRKVQTAIEIFKKTANYIRPDTNMGLPIRNFKHYLNDMEQSCKSHREAHYRKIPARSKPIESFQHLDGAEIDLNNLDAYLRDPNEFQFNLNLPVIDKLTKTKHLLKMHSGNRTLSDFEVANGLLERMLLGECHPDVHLVHNAKGERVGSTSEMYPDSNFISIKDYLTKYSILTTEKIITSEMVKVLAVFYIQKESDYHNQNFAFVTFMDKFDNKEKTLCVCFDNDRTDMELVGKYHDSAIDSTLSYLDIKFETELNLDTFPTQIKRPKFRGFIQEDDAEPNWIDKASQDHRFKMDKYQIFLKRILLPDSAIRRIGQACFSSETKKDLFINNKISCGLKLKEIMLQDKNFQSFFIENMNELFAKCYREFHFFNESLNSEESYLKICLPEVIDNIQKIQKEILTILKETQSPLFAAAQNAFDNFTLPDLPYIPDRVNVTPATPTNVPSSSKGVMPKTPQTPNTPHTPNTPQTPHTPETPNGSSVRSKRKINYEVTYDKRPRRLEPINTNEHYTQHHQTHISSSMTSESIFPSEASKDESVEEPDLISMTPASLNSFQQASCGVPSSMDISHPMGSYFLSGIPQAPTIFPQPPTIFPQRPMGIPLSQAQSGMAPPMGIPQASTGIPMGT